jgi:hypothetical protein
MTNIADILKDLNQRIAESERRIAQLGASNAPEAAVLMVNAIETLRALQAHKSMIEEAATTAQE